ncbi:MAG: response regulator transcription factor [Balneolaceae bacterium]
MANIRILLVDDHELIREGLHTLLSREPGLEVAGEAADGHEAVEKCRELEPNLVIMDINMPGLDGVQATGKIRELMPEIKVLALTMSDDDSHIREMIMAGASGYILKNAGKEELKKAIRTISEGKHYFSNTAARSVLMDMVQGSGKREMTKIHITEREREVLLWIVRELTNQEIAEKLSISVRTVDAHRRNLLQKTNSRNAAGLVRYALENNLVKDR